MAKSNFAAALAATLVHEGGWADHPRDPGGATMKGVTLATFRRYRPGATKEQLRNISNADLDRIYRDGYWNIVRGEDLPAGVDYAVFDFAVNSGAGRAAKFLQSLIGVPEDGKIGPVTLAAVAECDPAMLVQALCDKRLAFLRGLSTWDAFGNGWKRRVDDVLETALLMAVASAPPIDDIDHHPQPIPTVPLPEPKSGGMPGWLTILFLIGLAAAGLFLFRNVPLFS